MYLGLSISSLNLVLLFILQAILERKAFKMTGV